MTMVPVQSSNVAAVGWQDNTLVVQFNNGGTYEYPETPKATYDALLASPSKGRFVAQVLRGMFCRKR